MIGNNTPKPISAAAFFAAQTLLRLCQNKPPSALHEGLKIMDGDPGLPEITGRLTSITQDNGSTEALAIVSGIVCETAAAARDVMSRYEQQPTTQSPLTRLQNALKGAPTAKVVLSGIIDPALMLEAAKKTQEPAQMEIRPVKVLRFLAATPTP